MLLIKLNREKIPKVKTIKAEIKYVLLAENPKWYTKAPLIEAKTTTDKHNNLSSFLFMQIKIESYHIAQCSDKRTPHK